MIKKTPARFQENVPAQNYELKVGGLEKCSAWNSSQGERNERAESKMGVCSECVIPENHGFRAVKQGLSQGPRGCSTPHLILTHVRCAWVCIGCIGYVFVWMCSKYFSNMNMFLSYVNDFDNPVLGCLHF